MNTHTPLVGVATKNQDHAFKSPLLERFVAKKDAYFSSPSYVLLAKPPFANLLSLGRPALYEKVMESLRFAKELGHDNPVVVGAVPFDANRKPYLRLSANSEFGVAFDAGTSSAEIFKVPQSTLDIKAAPDAHHFKRSVSDALRFFRESKLKKVVLSRTLSVSSKKPFTIKPMLKRLQRANPSGYVFALDLVSDESKRHAAKPTLVGASPELLISLRNGKIYANPLAGSESKSCDANENKRLSEQLMTSEKDRREHQLVVDEVKKVLAPLCCRLHVPSEPSVIATPTMLHLSTEIEGELADSNISSIEIALALHPTPAVCGFPRKQARDTIADLESYDRDAFTGIAGWCNASGDGDWVVTIRCAKIEEHKATLYAGAGVVEGSSPEKEWRETGAKFKTMLDALGVNTNE